MSLEKYAVLHSMLNFILFTQKKREEYVKTYGQSAVNDV